MIGKIAVAAATFAIDKPYSYNLRPEMTLRAGMRVTVPFGRGNRRCEGVVLSVEEGSNPDYKYVEQVLDDEPVLSDTMLRLAAFLRGRCFCTFYDAIRAMLPGGLWFRVRQSYRLTDDLTWKEKPIRQMQAKAILERLDSIGGEVPESALLQIIPSQEEFQKAVAYLLRKKWIAASVTMRRNVGDKTQQVATLNCPPQEAMERASRCPKSAQMQKNVLETMCAVGSVSVKELCYYTGCGTATVRTLAKQGYLSLTDVQVLRCEEIKPARITGPLVLSDEQQRAYEGLNAQMCQDKPGGAVLYGITGSGKTSVYIRLIQSCLERGKQAMLMVPEIALTPQLIGLLAAYFGKKVAVLHSSLPMTQRYDQWKRVRSGEAQVVVGTRSAVFAPCPRLGLIIIDEEQEHSYQSENTPRYHAREVALWRGAHEKFLVVMGSATPSVETMYRAQTGIFRLYKLQNRYNGKPLPRVSVVDMHEELAGGNDSPISYPLQLSMEETMGRGKQTVLFLNRRGNSRAMVCVDCRKAPECPRCSQRLTYHSANHRLMCHYCGFSQGAPDRCPACGGPLKTVGVGTQRVEHELHRIFGDIDVERMDTDTVDVKNSHEVILERFQKNQVPVLVGTQMVAKGLNLPNVTLVGVLDADISLYAGNYRAAETTFNMLTQVVGRAGRGDAEGTAVIQTMDPENAVIRLAAAQDYDGFYNLEIGVRKALACPPFGDMVTVTFVGTEEAQLLRGSTKFRDSLSLSLPGAGVLGPAPCPVPKINFKFRYQLTLKCSFGGKEQSVLSYLLCQFSKDGQNRGISVFANVNGYE